MSHPLRVAINGYGRIGRCVLRALYETGLADTLQVVAINEPADLATMAYLTQYDSTHGVFTGQVAESAHGLIINGRSIAVSHEREPEAVDWAGLQIDLLLECSGQYSRREDFQRFVDAGCQRVLVSHPGKSAEDVDYTVVFGVNDAGLKRDQRIVSNASCTTNAIVPILAWLDEVYGVRHAFLTTLHSVMNDQPMIDGYHHSDLRRTRSAMQSFIPVETGLAQGVLRLLPQLAGKVQAKAIRVPVLNVSAIDLMVNLGQDVPQHELNQQLSALSKRHQGLIAYSERAHASIDFNHDPHSAIIDATQTRTNGDGFANLLVWFDNEWGFASRMLDTARAWAHAFAEEADSLRV